MADAGVTGYSGVSDLAGKFVGQIALALNEKAVFATAFDKSMVRAANGRTYMENLVGVGSGNEVMPIALDAPSVALLTDGTSYATYTAITTSHPTYTIKEYGLMAKIPDGVREDTIQGASGALEVAGIQTFQNSILNGKESDLAALASGFSGNAETHSGSDLTLAIWRAAWAKLRTDNFHSYGEDLMGFLSVDQFSSLSGDLDDASTYSNIGEKILNTMGKAMQANWTGIAPLGVPIWVSNHVATSGSDSVGLMCTPSAIFLANKRQLRVEFDRTIGRRANEFFVNERVVLGEWQDDLGCKIISQ